MSRIMLPPLPIRMPFWDSVSTQSNACTVVRPSSRSVDLLHLDLDRVRQLVARPRQRLLANQLRERDLARLVDAHSSG